MDMQYDTYFLLQKLNIFPENDLVIKNSQEIKLIRKKKINFKENYSPYLSIFSSFVEDV